MGLNSRKGYLRERNLSLNALNGQLCTHFFVDEYKPRHTLLKLQLFFGQPWRVEVFACNLYHLCLSCATSDISDGVFLKIFTCYVREHLSTIQQGEYDQLAIPCFGSFEIVFLFGRSKHERFYFTFSRVFLAWSCRVRALTRIQIVL